jgi:predicted nuclease of restriction endonuclease-like (RecB) superfamily
MTRKSASTSRSNISAEEIQRGNAPINIPETSLPDDAIAFISEIKEKVRIAQYEAMKVVNTVLVDLYWQIGKSITEKQQENWGKSIVSTLSKELQKEFPGTKGFSASNLWEMAKFYSEYSVSENLQPLVGEISWSKHIIILSRCKDNLERQSKVKLLDMLAAPVAAPVRISTLRFIYSSA